MPLLILATSAEAAGIEEDVAAGAEPEALVRDADREATLIEEPLEPEDTLRITFSLSSKPDNEPTKYDPSKPQKPCHHHDPKPPTITSTS